MSPIFIVPPKKTGRRTSHRHFPYPEQEVKPGAKLLCIDDSNLKRAYTPGTPIRGHIYCVRKLYTNGGRRGVLLVGIIGPTQSAGLEQGFYLSRFRWVHE